MNQTEVKFDGVFFYSLLKFKDIVREEQLNIGMLFYFPNSGRFCFKSFDVKRLETCFGLDENYTNWVNECYLQGFEKVANELKYPMKNTAFSKQKEYFSKAIEANFIPKNDGCVDFGKEYTCLKWHNDEDKIINDTFNKYSTYQK